MGMLTCRECGIQRKPGVLFCIACKSPWVKLREVATARVRKLRRPRTQKPKAQARKPRDPENGGEWVPLAVDEVLRETEKAFLFRLDGKKNLQWLAKSTLREPAECKEGRKDFLIEVAYWLAEVREFV